MSGVSIHVVDVTRGVVAAGMRVEVEAVGTAYTRIADALVSPKGSVDDPALSARFEPGFYDVLLHVGAFYARAGFALPGVPFLDVVTYRFGIDDPAQHYHLPFKLTPWGYSCFRGGA
ncbi:MAG TPA: hydroxyisourate hydrolase [Casimicrobiaceae bacterium]|nr:hydroxyisourate hydrolase [Casimicrobiaceae bacterium]